MVTRATRRPTFTDTGYLEALIYDGLEGADGGVTHTHKKKKDFHLFFKKKQPRYLEMN